MLSEETIVNLIEQFKQDERDLLRTMKEQNPEESIHTLKIDVKNHMQLICLAYIWNKIHYDK